MGNRDGKSKVLEKEGKIRVMERKRSRKRLWLGKGKVRWTDGRGKCDWSSNIQKKCGNFYRKEKQWRRLRKDDKTIVIRIAIRSNKKSP